MPLDLWTHFHWERNKIVQLMRERAYCPLTFDSLARRQHSTLSSHTEQFGQTTTQHTVLSHWTIWPDDDTARAWQSELYWQALFKNLEMCSYNCLLSNNMVQVLMDWILTRPESCICDVAGTMLLSMECFVWVCERAFPSPVKFLSSLPLWFICHFSPLLLSDDVHVVVLFMIKITFSRLGLLSSSAASTNSR